MPDQQAIERFNRRLDALLSGQDALPAVTDDEMLSVPDHQALGIAARLNALNPSLETRSRFPLRRRLRGRPPAALRRSWRVSVLRLTPGLSLLLAVVCVFVGVAAGVSVSPTQAAVPTAEPIDRPQPIIASAPAFLPQPVPVIPVPIPTPAAPRQGETLVPINAGLQETPGLSTQQWIQNPGRTGPNAGDS